MYFEESYYPYDKWEIFKLKILSFLGSKKAKEQLHYIELDMYYWWKWQRIMWNYCRLNDENMLNQF